MKRFEAPTEPTGETIPDPYEERRAALTAERQKARREEQDYAAVRRNVEEFLSPPEMPPGTNFLPRSAFSPELLPKRQI